MLSSKYPNRRYHQTPQPPPQAKNMSESTQIMTPVFSATNGIRMRLMRPERNTQAIQIKFKSSFKETNQPKPQQNPNIIKQQKTTKIANKIDIEIDTSQQNKKWNYNQWLQRNCNRIGIKKNNFQQSYSKSFSKNIEIQTTSKNQEEGMKNKPATQKGYFSLSKGLKAPPHLEPLKISSSMFGIFKQQQLKVQYHKIKNNGHSSIIQNHLSSLNQQTKQKQSQFEKFKSLTKNIKIEIKREPGSFASFRKPNALSLQAQQQSISSPIDDLCQVIVNKPKLSQPTICFFAESYKGRRPYNQDRYFCKTRLCRNQFNSTHLTKYRDMSKYQHNSLQSGRQSTNTIKDKFDFFAVFDGHGGAKCSQYLKQHFYSVLSHNRNIFSDPSLALKQTFLKMQQNFLQICQKSGHFQTSGSCTVACLIKNNNIYIGNIGDSRLYLLNQKQILQVTKDHKPDDKIQKARIIKYGGKLYKDGAVLGVQGKQNIKIFNQTRIMPGSLNVSRTIGDIETKLKKYGGLPGIISAEPDLFIQAINGRYQYLILCSDGLVEGLDNDQIHSVFVRMLSKQKSKISNLTKQNSEQFTKILTKQLIGQASIKSNDNITVICVKLPTSQAQAQAQI